MRFGKAASRVSPSAIACGMPRVSSVSNRLGAMVITRIPNFASSRAILFDGLKAGVTYVMQLCAIGGSTGQGDWNEPASKMAL